MSPEGPTRKAAGIGGKAFALMAGGCAAMMLVRALHRKGGSTEPLCPCAAIFTKKEARPEGGPA